jgi:predicted small lipoprotein YifL
MPIRALSLALIALAALSACGLRGPLYLPDDQNTDAEQAAPGDDSKPRRPAPAPQSQKRDRDGQGENEAPTQSAPPDPDRPANVPIIPPGN